MFFIVPTDLAAAGPKNHRQRVRGGCGLGLQAAGMAGLRVLPQPTNQEIDMPTQAGQAPDRIDVNDPAACAHWAQKLDTTEQQLRDAVKAVGDKAADVEMHLKGSHSTTNADRMDELGGS